MAGFRDDEDDDDGYGYLFRAEEGRGRGDAPQRLIDILGDLEGSGIGIRRASELPSPGPRATEPPRSATMYPSGHTPRLEDLRGWDGPHDDVDTPTELDDELMLDVYGLSGALLALCFGAPVLAAIWLAKKTKQVPEDPL